MAIATHWCDWNWAGAEKEFKRGPPHSLQGRENLAMVLDKWGEIAAIPYSCHQTGPEKAASGTHPASLFLR